jgi:hypothetical protein
MPLFQLQIPAPHARISVSNAICGRVSKTEVRLNLPVRQSNRFLQEGAHTG